MKEQNEIPDELFRELDWQRVTNIVRMLNNMGAIFEIDWEGIKYTNKTLHSCEP